MHTPDGFYAGTGIGNLDWTVELDDLVDLVIHTLDALQDDVAEATTDVWPHDPAPGEGLPPAWATVENGLLDFGYGSRTLGENISVITLTAGS